jgi:hypothetical protein
MANKNPRQGFLALISLYSWMGSPSKQITGPMEISTPENSVVRSSMAQASTEVMDADTHTFMNGNCAGLKNNTPELNLAMQLRS